MNDRDMVAVPHQTFQDIRSLLWKLSYFGPALVAGEFVPGSPTVREMVIAASVLKEKLHDIQ